ncbi:MAG: hypothetical protein VB815_06455 [Dehalococcoidia bacterium]|tara:strand:+ start:433 stop:624 length:192 start_codon:yes stop_codon:yes gene_type:complete
MDRISPYRIVTGEPERRSVAGVLAIEAMIPDHMPVIHTEISYESLMTESGIGVRPKIVRQVAV